MEGDKQFGSWLRASTPNPWKKTIVHVAGYEDDESSDTEAVPRAEQSTGVVDADARGSVDPKEVHMECRGDACVHPPSEGEYKIERARAGSTNLGALGESFKWGLLLYLIINSYIFF